MGLLRTIAHLYHPRRSNNHRARVLHPEVLGIFSLMIVAAFTSINALGAAPGRLGSVLGYASNISPVDVITQTNEQRATQGLGVLKSSDKLTVAAAAKAQDMFAKQYWAHTAPDGTQPWNFIKTAGYSYQVAGENLARDFSITNEMVGAWMASPTHRANIMNSRYSEIGIAVVNGTLEGVETTLVVQMFGLPRIAVAQVPKPTPLPSIVKNETTDGKIIPSPVPLSPEAAAGPLVSVEQTIPVLSQPVATDQGTTQPQVLASALLPQGSIELPPLFTPLQISKAIFLSLIMMLVFTLVYDALIVGNRQVVRLVGHNLSHVLLFSFVAFLIISFKAGILG